MDLTTLTIKSAIVFVAIIVGPLPFSAYLFLRFTPQRKPFLIAKIFRVIVSWILISMVISPLFGIFGTLQTRYVLIVELILFYAGIFLLYYGYRKHALPTISDKGKWYLLKREFSFVNIAALMLVMLIGLGLGRLWFFVNLPEISNSFGLRNMFFRSWGSSERLSTLEIISVEESNLKFKIMMGMVFPKILFFGVLLSNNLHENLFSHRVCSVSPG